MSACQAMLTGAKTDTIIPHLRYNFSMAKLTNNEILKMKIKRIEKEIRDTPYHKGTEHHIGKLRARLAKLKDSETESLSRKTGGGGGYAVKKQGDATVVLVGPPSAGKSTLLNALTNAESKVAPYAFTTVSVIPGMMKYNEAYIQILDVPGLVEGAEEGKGRGREVLSVARGADLLLILTDSKRMKAFARITAALERNGIRVNKKPPLIRIDKKLKGGIMVRTNLEQDLSRETIKEVAGEMGIKNAEIVIQERLSMETLIDSFSKSRVYVPTLYVVNKADELENKEKSTSNDYLYISAEKGAGLELLREKIWETLKFVTIYLIKPEEKPNTNNPIITKMGDALFDVAQGVGTDFADTKKKAKIWGPGAKHPGQEVSLKTQVRENMQVRFI